MELSHLSNFFKKYEQFVSRDVEVRDILLPELKKVLPVELPRESISVVQSTIYITAHPAYQTLIRMRVLDYEKILQEKLREKKITIVC